jgi:hypothetical protein
LTNVQNDELFAALRKSLDEIPPERRGPNWLKTSVIVNCLFRKEGGQAFTELQELKARRKPGESLAFDEFVRKVLAVADPWTLSSHGFKKSLASRDSAKNWRIIADVGAFLEELGYDWCINSGTLLGVVRDNDFIPHDDDADLAVILPGQDLASVMQNWMVLRSELARRDVLGFEGKLIHFKLKWPGGLAIDLFPGWIKEGRVFIFPHTGGEVGIDVLYPLRVHSIEGAPVKLPAVPEAILELNYGRDWRIPDAAWRFDWVGARAKFRGLRAAFEAAKSASDEASAAAAGGMGGADRRRTGQ